MPGLSIFDPSVRPGPIETALCSDHQTRRIGMQSLGYDFLAHVRTVGVRSVDEIYSQFHRRRKTRMALARSAGSPQIPLPVMRMDPNPKRVT